MVFVQIALVDKCPSFSGNAGHYRNASGSFSPPEELLMNSSSITTVTSDDEGIGSSIPYFHSHHPRGLSSVPGKASISGGETAPEPAPIMENFYSFVEVADILKSHDNRHHTTSINCGANCRGDAVVRGGRGSNSQNHSKKFHPQPFYMSSGVSSGSTSTSTSGNGSSILTRSGYIYSSTNRNHNDYNEDNNSFLNVSGSGSSEEENNNGETCSSNGYDSSSSFIADFRRDKLGHAAPYTWDLPQGL